MGGGDFACIFLFKLPGETSRPGEFRGLPYPFPVNTKQWEHWGKEKNLDSKMFLENTLHEIKNKGLTWWDNNIHWKFTGWLTASTSGTQSVI